MSKQCSLFAAVAVLVCLLSANAQAQEEQRELPPPGGTPKDFSLPAKETVSGIAWRSTW